jgi:SAM-dependent methyltransferase
MEGQGMGLTVPIEFDRTDKGSARLQERHKRIIDANLDAIVAKRVLDLASNNGRWSYAAVAAGAASVTGVEGRREKVAEAEAIFESVKADKKYKFHVDDMFDWLAANRSEPVDTILCLGVFYHIMDHYRLMTLMSRTSASTLIIDSGFVRSFRNSVHVQTEDPRVHPNALPKFQGQKAEFAGFVSLGLMIQMAWNLGFNCRPVLWAPGEIANRQSVHDYIMGARYTLRLSRTGRHVDEDWRPSWERALVALNPQFAKMFDPATHDSVVDARVRQPFKSMQFSIL